MLETIIGSVVTGIGIGIGAFIAAAVVHLCGGAKHDSERRHREMVDLMEDRNEHDRTANHWRAILTDAIQELRNDR